MSFVQAEHADLAVQMSTEAEQLHLRGASTAAVAAEQERAGLRRTVKVHAACAS